ncbi:MAG: Fe-S cluster assembly protein SufD [Bacteroidetes bacterium]|nr:Fe-S cluster assembly protein SufD [Bacteroidota bacterium]
MAELIDHRVEDRFLAAYERYQSLNGTSEPLSDLSKKAIERFAEIGFPARKNESWKYTNITPIIGRTYQMASTARAATKGIAGLTTHVAVFINGRFTPEASQLDQLPPGVSVKSLSATAEHELVQTHLGNYADYTDESFTALNTAFLKDGAVISIESGCKLDHPVHIIHIVANDEATIVQPRTLIHAANHASAQIIQSTEFRGSTSLLMNAVTEIYVGNEAHVDFLDLQVGTPHVSRITNLSVYQKSQSKFESDVFTFGGELTRNNLSILADGENCESLLHGLFMARGNSHIDNNTFVDHAKPNCYSSEYYKGILDHQSVGVFNGKVLVREDAQLINAYQTNRSILLSDTARMYSKPALEIYADDVKCSHGATTGQLDKDGLFYLRSRGIPEEEARRLMLTSFAGDIIEKAPVASLHELLYDHVECMLR